MKEKFISVAPLPVLCTLQTSAGLRLCRTLISLAALGPTSILSRLKCESRMHSARMRRWHVPSRSCPGFYPSGRKLKCESRGACCIRSSSIWVIMAHADLQ